MLGVVRRTGVIDLGRRGAIADIVGAVPKPSSPGKEFDVDRVTLRQLRAFKTVADVNSFSLAAHRLRLSQPSVSYQVKELEDTLGLPLLDRLGKRVHLTGAGFTLFGHARRKPHALEEGPPAAPETCGHSPPTPPVGASTNRRHVLPASSTA